MNRGTQIGAKLQITNRGDHTAEIIYSGVTAPEKSADNLLFTGRFFLYVDRQLSNDESSCLYEQAVAREIDLVIRDTTYAEERNKLEVPLAFISHDSRDKDDIARPIATRLRGMGCPVWYDEFSLTVGQSLRESIEEGLLIRNLFRILKQN